MGKRRPRPTNAELEILQVLWELGPCTVREVHEALLPSRATGYTTILKLLQNMHKKRLVARDDSRRSHIYSAHFKREQTQRQLVRDLLGRAFGGSADKLVMQVLQAKKVTPDEVERIRRMLDEWDSGR